MTSSTSFGPLQSSSPSLLPMQIQAFSAQTTRLIHVIEKSETKLFESNYRAYVQMYVDLKLSLAPAILSSEKAVGTPSHLSEQAGLYMARAKQMNALVKQTLKKHSSVIFCLSATPTDINDCKRFWNTYKTLYSKTPLPKPLSDDAKLEYDPESKRYILPEALTAPLLEAQQQSLAYTQIYYLLKSSLKVLLQSPLNRKTTKKIHSNLKQLHRDSTRRLHLEKSLKSPFLETIALSAMSQQIHRSVRNEEAHAIQSAICKRQKTLPPLSSTLFEMIQIPLKSGNVLLAEWMAAHVSQDASWEKGIEQMAIGSLCIDNDFEKAHEILITHLPDSDIRLSAELALLEELAKTCPIKLFFKKILNLSPNTSRIAHEHFLKPILRQGYPLIVNSAALAYELATATHLDLDGFKTSMEPFYQGGLRPGMKFGTYEAPSS